MDPVALANAVEFLGGDNVILQIASEQLRRDVLNGGGGSESPRYPPGGPEVKIPVPTTPGSNSSSTSTTSSVAAITTAAIVALIGRFYLL